MNRKLVRTINGILAGGCLVYGGSVVYRAATNDGGWDNLSPLCRFSIIIWILSTLILVLMWGRCFSACDNAASPDSCEDNCNASWGGLFMLLTLLLGFACGHIRFPN